jgi:hypothetical protein
MRDEDEVRRWKGDSWFDILLVPRDVRALRKAEAALQVAHGAGVQATATDVDLRRRVDELERALLATALYCRTLLQLLADKNLVTAEEFQKRMNDLDLLDGVMDGR